MTASFIMRRQYKHLFSKGEGGHFHNQSGLQLNFEEGEGLDGL